MITCTHGRSKVGWCTPPTSYMIYNFYSRYPQKRSKLWAASELLTPISWIAYFVTIVTVVTFLKLSCYFGRKLGLNTITEEISLVPFR